MTTISQQFPNTELPIAMPFSGKRMAFSGKRMAFGFALAIVGVLIFTPHGGIPLPFLEWTGAFLLAVITTDLRDRRIPNWLTFPSLMAALILAWDAGGAPILRDALLGTVAIFLILFPIFALRAIGAGDVKAMMVLGALWGPAHIFPALPFMAGAGALLALGRVAMQGEIVEMLRRWFSSIKLSILNRNISYIRPEAGTAAASGIPFAVAIGLGTIAYQWSRSLGAGGQF
jgi:prepilin peptidase CpaA